jgi:c(7)-type cytochrome triheme protein
MRRGLLNSVNIKISFALILGLGMTLLISCQASQSKVAEAEKTVASEQVIPVKDALKQLPCFKCHKIDSFVADVKGEFPHKKHLAFDVHCNQCHQVQGHEKPMVFMDACRSCHDIQNLSYEAEGLPVTFTHEQHAKRNSCSECHPALFNMKKGTTPISMDKIYAGKLCGACHNGKKAFSSQSCTKCHNMKGFKKSIKYPGGGMPSVVFSHEFHTAMFGCTDCHDKIFQTKAHPGKMQMAEMYQGKLCGSCHNGQMAFASTDCQRCHK